MIVFQERGHKYINTDNNHEYLSGTRFLHNFTPEFEEDKIAGFVAKKRGISKQEVIAEWRANSKKACDYGTNIHNAMEYYIIRNEIKEEYQSLYDSYDKHIAEVINGRDEVHSELLLYNDEYEIAGTADLIFDHGKEFTVGDFKTNKEFNFYSKYGNNMLDPVGHLSDCQHNLYTLQLSLYAYFYSIMTGKKCRQLFILYKSHESNEWVKIPCNYMEHEVRLMLKYYKKHLINTKH